MHVSLAPRRKGSPTVGEQQLKNRYFLFVLVTSGLLLAVTGLAKLWSSLGAARALLAPDPLPGVPYKHLLAGVAVMEIVVATICFLGRSRHLALALVAYLSTNFMLYRIGLWWIGWKQPCGCMGSLADALHIRPQTADHIAFVLLLYMLAASYALLVVLWKNSSWQSNPTSALLEEVSAQKDQL